MFKFRLYSFQENLIHLFLVCIQICFATSVLSQSKGTLDVISYSLDLSVSDTTDRIYCNEKIAFYWLDTLQEVSFDLISPDDIEKGMIVSAVYDGSSRIIFRQQNNKLNLIGLKANGREKIELIFVYSGIPEDGLVIGKNKYGDRTFFADNWPNRASNWFICIDHPSDKAFVNYTVKVPSNYEVIANGVPGQKTILNNQEVLFRYSSTIPLPTKVMVIGIAEFSVKELGMYSGVPISSYVYPQNEVKGFYDFDLAPEIVAFFVNYIGPYEFEKLANVQSTTRFGGMENAGCIFYDENAINGRRTCENLIAHEIAHQWFGNSATEMNWEHLWLSEGFATYFTNLYIEETKGQDAFKAQLIKDRKQVLSFYQQYPHPIVDTAYVDLMHLLNANSYQKGAWVLHMLRRKIGDVAFKKGIVQYYQKYRLSNATTNDFMQVMEEVSGLELEVFFDQWIFQSGHPQLEVTAKQKGKKLDLRITQIQTEQFDNIPLMIELEYEDGTVGQLPITLKERVEHIELSSELKIKSWKLDPNVDLLFEVSIN